MIMLWVGVSWRGWDRMDVTSEKYTNIMRASELLLSQHEEEISIPSFPEGIKVFLDTFHVGDYAFSSRHWHRSIQFNVILEGTLDVSVNGKDILLQRGDGIFINSNVFHHLNFKGESECVGYSFQLHPSAICSEKDIYLYTKYVASVINNADLNYLTFKEDVPWHSGVLNYLNRAFISANQQDFAYELDVKNLLSCAWMLMLRNYNSIPANNTDSYTLSNAPRIKDGTETPSRAIIIIPVSQAFPRLTAARTPSNNPIRTAKIRERIPSSRDTGNAPAIISVTCLPLTNEFPRSPVHTFPI